MTVQLLVPGLLGPLPRGAGALAVPRLPRLEQLLSRADRAPGLSGLAGTLFDRFGLPVATAPATAPLCFLADAGRAPVGWVCHADPVHLVPDQDRLLLFDAPRIDLTQVEALAFVDAFNRHFAADGAELHAPRPGRWYLTLNREPEVTFRDLDAVIGRSLEEFLPTGGEAPRWRGFLNEVQMLFHGLPVNDQREREGKPTVNGVWFSGAGLLPQRSALRPARAAGGAALLSGLCRWCGVDEAGTEEVLARGGVMLVPDLQRALLDADAPAWVRGLERCEQLLAMASTGILELYPCNGSVFVYLPKHHRRWWRRPKPITRLVDGAADQTS